MALSTARSAVFRSTALFTPFLIVTLAVLVLLLRDLTDRGMSPGLAVGTMLVAFVALLLGYQVVQSVRDLLTQPVETVGVIERSWSRNEFVLFRNSYIFIDRNVFRLTQEQYQQIAPGDVVRVVHYPHTSAVERIEVVTRVEERGSANDG